jgi:hypothetical protein
LDNSENTVQMLTTLLERLAEKKYAVVAPLETRL